MMREWNTIVLVLMATLLAGWLVWILVRLGGFVRELRYLKIEIGRSRRSEERYWVRRRRRLWLSLFFPFVKY